MIELRSVDGFTALSIAADLRRMSPAQRRAWWAGYLIGRASQIDDDADRRSRAISERIRNRWAAEESR